MCELHRKPRSNAERVMITKAAKSQRQLYEGLHRIADAGLGKVSRAIQGLFSTIGDAVDMNKLTRLLENGDIAGVEKLMSGIDIDHMLEGPINLLFDLFMQGAQHAKTVTPKTLVKKVEYQLPIAFDITNPETIEFLRQYRFDLISLMKSKTMEGIRQILLEAFNSGMHPYQQAQMIKQGIGLLPRQASALENYRKMLMDEGRQNDQIKRMVEAYRNRLLKQRAVNIARTETIRASTSGQYALWRQAAKDGLIDPTAKVKWIVTPDDRLCPICEGIGRQPPVQLESNFSYTMQGAGAGSLPKTYSGMTPPIHPQCRCAIGLVP